MNQLPLNELKAQVLSVLLKIVLKNANKKGFEIHSSSRFIESFSQKKTEGIIITLTLDEIQRISDLMSLRKSNIRKALNGIYIDLIQKKYE